MSLSNITDDPMLSEAQVFAVYPNERVIDINLLGKDRQLQRVLVVNTPNNYSFPQIGDIVLVLILQSRYYCIGTVEHGYRAKVDGTYIDKSTGKNIITKNVQPGEVFLTNLARRLWLYLSNSGNFSLMSGDNDGLAYYIKNRYLRLKGQVTQIIGSGTTASFGYVFRNLGKGYQPVASKDNPSTPAIEALIDIAQQSLRVVRFQIGEIKNALGIDELSTFPGNFLKAIIEVCQAGIPIAGLKMDDGGNVELSSLLGKTMIDGIQVQLGGISAAEPVIKGETYTASESAFLDSMTIFATAMTAFYTALVPAPPPISAAASTMLPAVTAFNLAISAFKAALIPSKSLKVKTT